MVQTYRYIDNYGATFYIDLGQSIRLGDIQGFAEVANLLEVGTSAVTHDDPNATLGNSGDAILGLKTYEIVESDAPVNDQRVFRGFITDREYSRGDSTRPSLITGSSRQIGISLVDANALASFRTITGTDGDRPAETPGARLAWLLASTYFAPLGLYDNGYVDYPTTPTMDAADYRQQKPADVINDCSLATSYNAFIYFDETHFRYALWFKDSNTSTAYTSTLSLAGIITDCDFVTSFPAADARLHRTPDHTFAGVSVPYAAGNVYVSRPATADTYGWRDGIAPNSNAKTSARATNDGNLFLRHSATEEDRITCTVELPSDKVNKIRAGMRLQGKWPWLPGYESLTYLRVLRRTVSQSIPDQLRYTLALELSPQGALAPLETCSAQIGSLQTDDSGAQFSLSAFFPPVLWSSIDDPAVYPAVVIGFMGFANQAAAFGSSGSDVSGFTKLADSRTGACSSVGSYSTLASVGYKALSSGSPGAMGVTWNSSNPIGWRGIAAYLRTSATAPVQSGSQCGTGGTVTLGSAPTPGNILICCRFFEVSGAGPPNPPPGFTTIVPQVSFRGNVPDVQTMFMDIIARCVVAGDSAVVDTGNASFSHWSFLSEWAIT